MKARRKRWLIVTLAIVAVLAIAVWNVLRPRTLESVRLSTGESVTVFYVPRERLFSAFMGMGGLRVNIQGAGFEYEAMLTSTSYFDVPQDVDVEVEVSDGYLLLRNTRRAESWKVPVEHLKPRHVKTVR